MSKLNVAFGFVAGAAIGALIGILMAPDKGAVTRKKMLDKAGDATDAVKHSFSDFIDNLKDSYLHAKQEADGIGQRATAKMSAVSNDLTEALT